MKKFLVLIPAALITLTACNSYHQPRVSSQVTPAQVAESKQPAEDILITGRVKTALFNDTFIPSSSINVQTINGVVYLSGSVDNFKQARGARHVAQSVAGVKGVKSSLVVVSGKVIN